MGVRVTPLKTLRAELGTKLAAGVSVNGKQAKSAPLGALVNAPAVVVQSNTEYVTALDYCSDRVQFDAILIAPPGDPAAVADAFDDMIDQVRATLRSVAPSGLKYEFRSVGGFTTYPSGDNDLPAAITTIAVTRSND
jgi:hypothetical protein